jgi:aminopeptidase
MNVDLERMLHHYGELAVKVGLNLQPGQRLIVIGPLLNGGVALEAAPLVRQVVASAYRAGAPLVEVLWGDESLLFSRFVHGPNDSFGLYSSWLPSALVEHVEAGHAVISVYANDPDLLKDQDAERVGAAQQAVSRAVRPFRERISRNQTNWAVIAAASPSWAAKVFPDAAPERQLDLLWNAIARLCRLHDPDPIGAWTKHIETLTKRSEYLQRKQYASLKYRGPGTDLTICLPRGHIWVSARSNTRAGVPFTANLPTEEVFTIPHRAGVEGTVRASKPLSYSGTLIDGFSLTFKDGRVIALHAERGEAVLRQLVGTDDGAGRLGEIALVPHNSPVAQSGLLFYSTLFDENAASHAALGSAYRFTLDGGEGLDDQQFEAAGGNQSAVHVDFMLGSPELDIDGVCASGAIEPVMRKGDWAFDPT